MAVCWHPSKGEPCAAQILNIGPQSDTCFAMRAKRALQTVNLPESTPMYYGQQQPAGQPAILDAYRAAC
jgi:hypothetical protein